MNKIDFTDLDGKVLRVFLTILAKKLGLEGGGPAGCDAIGHQPHVGRNCGRCWAIPLFVRSGQGLTPTERALSLKEPVQSSP